MLVDVIRIEISNIKSMTSSNLKKGPSQKDVNNSKNMYLQHDLRWNGQIIESGMISFPNW